MRFNMNHYVSVTLTERGAEIYNARWEGIPVDIFTLDKVEAGYVLRAQMWSLFQDFGEHIHLGCKMPFEGCLMTFDAEQFEKE